MSLVRNFDIVLLTKLTTKSAVPSLEMARLRAAFPVLTDLPALLFTRSHYATLQDKFIVTYIIELSAETTSLCAGVAMTQSDAINKTAR